MKVISGRFLSKTELINKILRDIIIAILFIAILVFIYFQIRSPIPVKFIFKSLFQDVKNNVIEEYSKIYYPTYYFSMQMTPIFDTIGQSEDIYKVLITNFFPKHNFIENAAMRFGNSYMAITKEGEGYKVIGNIVTNNESNTYHSMPFEQISIDSFYVRNNKPYIHLLYIASEDIAFEYNALFNINLQAIDINNIKDIYAYLVTGNSKITFPISESTTNESPSDYMEIANILTERFFESEDDILKISYNNKNYWGYKGIFTVANNTNQIGIIIPEKALIKRIQVPALLIFILFVIIVISIIIVLATHYVKIIEDLMTNHIDIKKIINEGESAAVEFKSTLRYDSYSEKINKSLEEVIMKSIAAFANAEGGRLFIGISDDGKILGLDYDYSTLKQGNKDFFELHLRTLIENYYGNSFSAECIRIDFIEEEGKDICIVYINKSNKPIYTKITNKQGAKEEKFFIRVGNSSREIASASEIIAYVNKHFKKF